VTAPESRVFYQVRGAGASGQRFAGAIAPLLILVAETPKKSGSIRIIRGKRVFVVVGGKVKGRA
jgi:hypothetical protein